jgi:hypothetical protein
MWMRARSQTEEGVIGWLRKRTSRLMFWATAARKNCSRTNFSLRRRKGASDAARFDS